MYTKRNHVNNTNVIEKAFSYKLNGLLSKADLDRDFYLNLVKLIQEFSVILLISEEIKMLMTVYYRINFLLH